MFARTAETITRKLQENNSISSEQYEICRFGIQQGLTIILNAITIIAIGAVVRELIQAFFFMVLYAPLRSNAGGYHARTPALCYIYSILLMIVILLAMKYLDIPYFICIITFIISCILIFILAPVEDANKPLDNTEQKVYKKRTHEITVMEIMIFIVASVFNVKMVSLCVMWVLLTMGIILLVGKCKNNRFRN